MRVFLIFLFLISTSSLSFGQAEQVGKNIAIRVEFESKNRKLPGRYPAMYLSNNLKRWVRKKYSLGKPKLILLKVSVESSNEKTIEGMETVILADVNLKLRIINTITGEEKEWEKVVKSKGSSLLNLKKAAVRKFIGSPGEQELIKFADDYLENEFLTNCQKYYDISTKKYDNGEYVEAVKILSYIQSETSCSKKAKNLMHEAFLMEQKKVCNDHIYKATLAYESGDYNSSVNHLYKISPSSPCAKEAMKLAKKLGKKFKKSDTVPKKTISVHQFILEHAQQDKHAAWNEKIILDLIRK